jgi:hypothetical protein
MPDRLGSSVEVSSSARAHLRQRMMATWTTGRDVDSMLVRASALVFEDGRSESDDEYDDEDEDAEDEDTAPAYGTCGGRVAAVDIVGRIVGCWFI